MTEVQQVNPDRGVETRVSTSRIRKQHRGAIIERSEVGHQMSAAAGDGAIWPMSSEHLERVPPSNQTFLNRDEVRADTPTVKSAACHLPTKSGINVIGEPPSSYNFDRSIFSESTLSNARFHTLLLLSSPFFSTADIIQQMGKLIWHDLSRNISLTASLYAVWAGLWGIFFRKFFWDFIGGILRTPGGLQPSPKAAIFITVIVRFPILQIITMILGFIMVALEYPVPILKGTALHRSFGLRVVLLTMQASVTVFFYQLTVMKASDIISAVPGRFEAAKSSEDLFFFPSEVSKYEEIGVEWEIRLCTALQKKPLAPVPAGEAEVAQSDVPGEASKKSDPFTPPYVPNLYVGDLRDVSSGTDYAILLKCIQLNKFSAVPHHFLLVTKEFLPQTSPLLPHDLVQTYLLLLAARKARKNYFAFYNSFIKGGSNSGASQHHKHIQFIEAEDDGPPIERLARAANLEVSGKPFSLTSMPYANHVYRLPNLSNGASPEQLEQVLFLPFLSLLDLVISTVRHAPDYPSGTPSYNVILTLEHMHLIPRRWNTYTLGDTGAILGVNSLGFAGMLMVKSQSEREALEQEKIGKVLRGVGVESVHELQVAGTSMEAMDETGT
ncbi:ATP adenylyltransferase-domain-containing protein [Suillus paluster]|uniref:ATP adenylyltransferase-domain-containing protein n=1 Tax=Suillus paluster TaxID=48578 RepID=UPI001B865F3E|nr:ATP adenylyltransferase-domain-containing protein [Suillus paluster]KAG1731504.1 ATP adenylyltransferase-domain-containing protein [Suillus paluster]